MRIGIDARLIEETGVGRYTQNLIQELGELDKANEYIVFLRKKSFDRFTLPNRRWKKVLADVPWHTLTEQFLMLGIFLGERLDLLHVPYFNVPIFYPGKFVVTIHDLTILHFDTGRATTLPLPLYKLKRLGYWLELAIGLRRAQKILAVSQSTKQEIIDHFYIDPAKIVVTYEGVDKNVSRITYHVSRRLIKGPYFLYVGNAYPHKNLETLLKAFQKFIVYNSQFAGKIKLVLVGPRDYFYERLSKTIAATKLCGRLILSQNPKTEELSALYKDAIALVFPSLMEGFGLPGIEAMAMGTPVVASDIPVFREIYGDAFLPFNPDSPQDIADKLKRITVDKNLRKNLIDKGRKQAARYSWRRMAEKTVGVYLKAVI